MGWLGYTEQETLATTILALEGALEALNELEMLRLRGAFVPVDTSLPAPPPPSGESIFAAFRAAAA